MEYGEFIATKKRAVKPLGFNRLVDYPKAEKEFQRISTDCRYRSTSICFVLPV